MQQDGVELTAEVDNRAEETLAGSVAMELSACRSELVILASEALSLPPKKITKATPFQARVEAPDFYTAHVSVMVGGRPVAKDVAVVGYRVQDIVPAVTRPGDFHEFWQRAVTEARAGASELQLHLTPEEEESKSGVRVPWSPIRGWGGRPSTGGT